MPAAPPTPEPPADPGVRLDVRVGDGRALRLDLLDGDVLLGGADGCDVRLPGHLPPVVGQFSLAADGLRVRRLAPAVPVAVNGRPLPDSAPVLVRHGDTVSVGPAEVTVHIPAGAYFSPRLIPLEPDESAVEPGTAARRLDAVRTELRRLEDRKAVVEGEELLARRELHRERAELEQRRAEIEQQARELEEDRAIWYRRRQQLEAEAARPDAAAERAEVMQLRQQLFDEFSAKRDQLVQYQDALRAAEADIEGRRSAADAAFADRMRELEAEIARRRLAFEDELRDAEPRLVELRLQREQADEQRRAVEQLRADLLADRQAFEADQTWQREQLEERERAAAAREADLLRREEQLLAARTDTDSAHDRYRDDLTRLDRWQAALEAKQQELDARAAEVDQRFDALRRNSGELEGHVRLADSEHARLAAEADRLDRLRGELDVRAATLAERAEQLDAQQATLAVLRAKLDRQQDEMREEAARLAADRVRHEQARAELDARLADAERVRADLDSLQSDHAARQRAFDERNGLLAATLEDFRRQKDELAEADERLRQKEQDLDTRSAEFAEQAALLKARLSQALELQQRLEADRLAVREREGTLTESDAARQAFQEQLRRRAEELSARVKEADETARRLAEDRAVFDRLRAGLDEEKAREQDRLADDRRHLDALASDLQKQAEGLAEREATLTRQVERMKEVGAAVAAERKALFDAKQAWEAERASAAETDAHARQQAESFHTQIAAHLAELRAQAPDLEANARAALEKLTASRDVLRGHLAELHDYARQTREELDAARGSLRGEAEGLRQRADDLDRARADHRLQVAGFRQQLLEWQAKVAELRSAMQASEARVEAKQAELDEAAQAVRETSEELARQTTAVRQERAAVAEKRAEMDRHLADMREWYRRKLRELAAGRQVDDTDMPGVPEGGALAPRVPVAADADSRSESATPDEPDPSDRPLGELLRTRGLIDEPALAALWAEARRQRRTLRQVLLASGAVTLYQLALIEAGNLDGLSLGRFRIVDRVRANPRETVYRVFDPSRPGGPTRGVHLLRHLAETEMADAVRPDEFRQRFGAAAAARHPNLANTLEVLELNGRPAAVQEYVPGLPSADWPPAAAAPGVWVRLLTEAAKGLAHAHKLGLVHGRLAAESFVLTADGTLKLLGLGEPAWLAGGPAAGDPPPSADLRGLGQVAFGWSQLGARRRGVRGRPFPVELSAVIRRLEIGAESGMGDVVAIDRPYPDAADLLRDLARLADQHPCPADGWEKLLRYAAENAPEPAVPLRQTA